MLGRDCLEVLIGERTALVEVVLVAQLPLRSLGLLRLFHGFFHSNILSPSSHLSNLAGLDLRWPEEIRIGSWPSATLLSRKDHASTWPRTSSNTDSLSLLA